MTCCFITTKNNVLTHNSTLRCGLAVGVVVGYVLRRMEDQGQFECLENELHGLTDKAKKKVKDVVDTGKNQVEYVKDRVEHMVEKPKSN